MGLRQLRCSSAQGARAVAGAWLEAERLGLKPLCLGLQTVDSLAVSQGVLRLAQRRQMEASNRCFAPFLETSSVGLPCRWDSVS